MSLGVGATRDCLPPTDSRSRPLSGAAETPGEQPARCAWAEIHVQNNAKDRGKQYAREWARRTLPVCMSEARAVTPDTRSDGATTTKYPIKGVLHDLARSNNDFRRG